MSANSRNDHYIPHSDRHIPNNAGNKNNLHKRQDPSTMDPNMMDIHIHNPMTNMIARWDNNMKTRDFDAIANYRYLHRNNSNRFDRQNAVPVDNMNLHHALSLIAYSNPEKGTPSILTAKRVLKNLSLFS
jgi:hypothetical protein